MERAERLYPGFMNLNKNAQIELLLQEDTTPQLQLVSYRFFMDLFKQRRLVNLTARGEGVCAQADPFGEVPLYYNIYLFIYFEQV